MSNNSSKTRTMTRREAILRVSSMLGGAALVGQSAMLASCGKAAEEPRAEAEPEPAGDSLFTNSDIALLDEIAETILPETDTPGAKAAEVGAFMALMVTDSYYPAEQQIFREGMTAIDQRVRDSYGSDFLSAGASERLQLLEELDQEQFDYMDSKAEDAPAHFFRMMKELALLGYFTSEIGYTQAMRYEETPGRFDPCVPYEEGDTIWADHA